MRSLPRTDKECKHPASRGASHHLDKLLGEARRRVRMIPVTAAPSPSQKRDFGDLQGFELYREQVGPWRRIDDPEEFGPLMIKERKARSTYKATASRRGQPEVVTRRDPYPIQNLTFVLHPAASDWVAGQVATSLDPKPALREILRRFYLLVQETLAGQRDLFGICFHADTDDLHFDFLISRQGPNGRIGKAGLGLVGPWCVAVDRQIRAGAEVGVQKRAQYVRAVANFRRRYGDAKPLDIRLCRALDDVSAAVIGAPLRQYVDAYAKSVPGLERAHALAAIAELDEARAKLAATIPPSPPAPSDAGHAGHAGQSLPLTP